MNVSILTPVSHRDHMLQCLQSYSRIIKSHMTLSVGRTHRQFLWKMNDFRLRIDAWRKPLLQCAAFLSPMLIFAFEIKMRIWSFLLVLRSWWTCAEKRETTWHMNLHTKREIDMSCNESMFCFTCRSVMFLTGCTRYTSWVTRTCHISRTQILYTWLYECVCVCLLCFNVFVCVFMSCVLWRQNQKGQRSLRFFKASQSSEISTACSGKTTICQDLSDPIGIPQISGAISFSLSRNI